MKRIARYFPHFPAIEVPTVERTPHAPTPTSPVPYLFALAIAVAVVAAIALLTPLPTGPVVEIATIFVGLAVVERWLEDVPRDQGGPWLRWCGERCAALRDAWGLVFYGLAALTTLVWLETGSLLRLEFGETLGNVLSAAVWWQPMWEAVTSGTAAAGGMAGGVGTAGGVGAAGVTGLETYVLILAGAWAFWLVLGIRPDEEPWLGG